MLPETVDQSKLGATDIFVAPLVGDTLVGASIAKTFMKLIDNINNKKNRSFHLLMSWFKFISPAKIMLLCR